MAMRAVSPPGSSLRGASGAGDARGDWAKAESEARKAETWMPWSHLPWSWIGEARLQRDDRAGARASVGKAISIERGLWTQWFDLARASTGATRRRALERAPERNPLAPNIEQLRRLAGDA